MQRHLTAAMWLLHHRVLELLQVRSRRGRSGQDLIEYALIVGFIAVACAAVIPYTATESMRAIYNRIAELLVNSVNQT